LGERGAALFLLFLVALLWRLRGGFLEEGEVVFSWIVWLVCCGVVDSEERNGFGEEMFCRKKR